MAQITDSSIVPSDTPLMGRSEDRADVYLDEGIEENRDGPYSCYGREYNILNHNNTTNTIIPLEPTINRRNSMNTTAVKGKKVPLVQQKFTHYLNFSTDLIYMYMYVLYHACCMCMFVEATKFYYNNSP